MFRILRDEKGFTMIELIIVIIIVGVLAAISVPMMSSNVDRAKRTEAIAAMGTIRMAERLCKVEFGSYEPVTAGAFATTANINKYIKAGDLNGRYYNDNSYSVIASGIGGTIYAKGGIAVLDCSMDLASGEITEESVANPPPPK